MSTILKALRRLEREKQPETGKPLRDDVVAYHYGEPQEARSRRTLAWVAGAALIAVAGGFWLASGARQLGHGERSPRVAGARPEAAVPEATLHPLVSPPEAEGSATSPARPAREPSTLEGTAGGTQAGDAQEPSALDRAPTVRERPYRLPDPEPLAAFELSPNAGASPETLPGMVSQDTHVERSLESPSAPPALPAVRAKVESTIWHPDASRRQARVSTPGRGTITLREGDAVGEFVILRIEPSGVVFLYRGQEIRQGVGE